MSALHHEVIWVVCPKCGEEGSGPQFITQPWDGETYGFACGHRAHLDESKGGAKTYLRPEPREDSYI